MEDELLERLLHNLDAAYYAIGGYKEHAYCLQRKGAGWEVYYGKNGVHLGSRTFAEKTEANKYFYRAVLKKVNDRVVNHVI